MHVARPALALWLLACTDGAGSGTDAGADGGFDWPGCERIDTQPGLLAGRAAEFDRLARDLHLAPDGLLRNVYLAEDLETVAHYRHTENTILWSGIYLASQALRYAVTGSAEAEQNARRVLDGLGDLTRLTGVRGLYGRCLADPVVCYDHDGHGRPGWTDSPVPGYEGWAYRNDVSKDGYDGLIFGYALAAEHFDDARILADVRERLREIADHIVGNRLQIVDADGQVTEHGALYQSALDDYPGFNAMLAASFVKVAQTALGDPELDDFYYACMMRTRSGIDCPPVDPVDLGPYIESMEQRLFLFQADCKQNYDNFDMCYQAIYPLLRRERDEALRARLLFVLRENMFHSPDERYQSLAPIGNAWYTFAYAALSRDDPRADPVLADAVDRAVCTLKDFPALKFDRPIPAGAQQEVCRSRLDEPVAAEPVPLSEYHFDNYLWRLDFFEIQAGRAGDRRLVYSPEDYLLAYWLGRYHGILDAGQ
ncbi:MAG: hypothetical protein JXR96_02145 [Deltaproteobacteria bacterium]|nr:hypothetical protein [Deltaproteobacteria bacterium]